jgi:RNA recognition motif-containing protein
MNIFVTKLDFNTDSEGLRTAFEAYGAVDSAKVINDRFTGKSRGFGFVEMPDDEQAVNAIESLNESDLNGSIIVVKQAEPRERHSSGDRSRGGYSERRNDYGGGRGRGGQDRDNKGGQRDDSRRKRDYDNDRNNRY